MASCRNPKAVRRVPTSAGPSGVPVATEARNALSFCVREHGQSKTADIPCALLFHRERADARCTLKWEDAHFRADQSWFSRHRLAASEFWLRTIVPNPSLAPLVRQPHHL